MSELWPECIITVIDVIDIKSTAKRGDSEASSKMRHLHSLAQTSMKLGMPLHAHSYCWNDSVLLLGFWNGEPEHGRNLLREASDLKRRIDEQIGRSYAISVKGRAFPDQVLPESVIFDWENHHPRCVVLKASSYAMANCYLIEAEAKKQKCRADWYIDSRLKTLLGAKLKETISVEMLPTGKCRRVFLLDGYII